MYQDDPTSKIFAPLAEAYRKIGLVDQAIEICLEGLAHHPDFVGGKVALARSYFEKKQFIKVREVLQPMIDAIPDNLVAQRLLADANFSLGFTQEALSSYKMLLYFNPSDREVAEMVQELETQGYVKGFERSSLSKSDQSQQKVSNKVVKLMKLQRLLNRLQDLQNQLKAQERGPVI